jgi:hypothetical protein
VSQAARLTRAQLLADDDPLVRGAVKRWTPVRWLAVPKARAERRRLESELQNDPERWARYIRLRQEPGGVERPGILRRLAFVAALWPAGVAMFGG